MVGWCYTAVQPSRTPDAHLTTPKQASPAASSSAGASCNPKSHDAPRSRNRLTRTAGANGGHTVAVCYTAAVVAPRLQLRGPGREALGAARGSLLPFRPVDSSWQPPQYKLCSTGYAGYGVIGCDLDHGLGRDGAAASTTDEQWEVQAGKDCQWPDIKTCSNTSRIMNLPTGRTYSTGTFRYRTTVLYVGEAVPVEDLALSWLALQRLQCLTVYRPYRRSRWTLPCTAKRGVGWNRFSGIS